MKTLLVTSYKFDEGWKQESLTILHGSCKNTQTAEIRKNIKDYAYKKTWRIEKYDDNQESGAKI